MNRLLYMDIYRAICILVVIYSHLLLFCVGYKDEAFITIFMRSFFLNAFFFISGYIFYIDKVVNYKFLIETIKKKFRSILIPSFVSLWIFSYISNFNYIDSLSSSSKGGYWFTFALFGMFLLFCLLVSLVNRISYKLIRVIIIIIFISILYYLNKISVISDYYNNIFLLNGIMYYAPAFGFGIICKLYNNLYYKILNNKFILLANSIIIFFIYTNYNIVPLILRNMSTTFFVLQLIYYTLNSINTSKYNKIISNLSIIGTNTLQIYFLHYYFLFRLPQPLISYMHSLHSDFCFSTNSCASIVEFTLLITISIFISYICIYLAKFINYIPFASKILFGKYK